MPKSYLVSWLLFFKGKNLKENIQIYKKDKYLKKFQLYSIGDFWEPKPSKLLLDNTLVFIQCFATPKRKYVTKVIEHLKKGGRKWCVSNLFVKVFPSTEDVYHFISYTDLNSIESQKGKLQKRFIKLLSPKIRSAYVFPFWLYI